MTTDSIIQAIDTVANSAVLQEVAQQTANADAGASNTGLIIAIIGLLIFAAHLFTEIFSRTRIPDVLLLMVIGLIIGPLFGWVKPEDLGSVASVFTTITLVIILFQSGTELNFNTLLKSIKGTMKLTTINFFVTMIIVAALGMLFEKDFDILTSLMMGAILGGTSSAVVIPMVSQLKVSQKGGTILILESAFSDVLCIVFAWAFLQAIKSGALNVGQVLGSIISSFILASIIGIIAAIFWSFVLEKVRHVKNSILTTPAFVFIVYGINEWLGFSGAIAALAFGICMANIDPLYQTGLLKRLFKTQPSQLNDTEKQLFSEVVFLLKTFFFIYIGVSIKLNQLWPLLVGFVIAIVLFILRIPVVRLSVHQEKDGLPVEDKIFMSGIVPKGLAAAVLATVPVQRGIEGAETIQNIVFAVILFSIIFTSVLIPVLDKDNAVSRFYKRCFGPKEKSIEEMLDNN